MTEQPMQKVSKPMIKKKKLLSILKHLKKFKEKTLLKVLKRKLNQIKNNGKISFKIRSKNKKNRKLKVRKNPNLNGKISISQAKDKNKKNNNKIKNYCQHQKVLSML